MGKPPWSARNHRICERTGIDLLILVVHEHNSPEMENTGVIRIQRADSPSKLSPLPVWILGLKGD